MSKVPLQQKDKEQLIFTSTKVSSILVTKKIMAFVVETQRYKASPT